MTTPRQQNICADCGTTIANRSHFHIGSSVYCLPCITEKRCIGCYPSIDDHRGPA